MAVVLYSQGNTEKVNGIPCQVQICNEFSYLHLLKQGWFYSPEECYAKEEEEEEITEETPEIEMVETGPSLIEHDIRTAARLAGISHWHNKSIDRLSRELEELKDDE